MNRTVNAAVFEHSAATILREGLVYDRCTIGVVTDLDDITGLESDDITDTDQLIKVMRTQVDVVLDDGCAVLHAADARIAALAELCDGAVMLYACDGTLPAIVAHRAAGGRAVFLGGGCLVLARGSDELVLCPIARLLHRSGLAQPERLLAGVAVAWAMDMSPDLIIAGLKTFEPVAEVAHVG